MAIAVQLQFIYVMDETPVVLSLQALQILLDQYSSCLNFPLHLTK